MFTILSVKFASVKRSHHSSRCLKLLVGLSLCLGFVGILLGAFEQAYGDDDDMLDDLANKRQAMAEQAEKLNAMNPLAPKGNSGDETPKTQSIQQSLSQAVEQLPASLQPLGRVAVGALFHPSVQNFARGIAKILEKPSVRQAAESIWNSDRHDLFMIVLLVQLLMVLILRWWVGRKARSWIGRFIGRSLVWLGFFCGIAVTAAMIYHPHIKLVLSEIFSVFAN